MCAVHEPAALTNMSTANTGLFMRVAGSPFSARPGRSCMMLSAQALGRRFHLRACTALSWSSRCVFNATQLHSISAQIRRARHRGNEKQHGAMALQNGSKGTSDLAASHAGCMHCRARQRCHALRILLAMSTRHNSVMHFLMSVVCVVRVCARSPSLRWKSGSHDSLKSNPSLDLASLPSSHR